MARLIDADIFYDNIVEGTDLGAEDNVDEALKRYLDLEPTVDAVPMSVLEEYIRQMKSEIVDSLEFWDYSPNNNPLARDILETVNTYCAKMVEPQESEDNK